MRNNIIVCRYYNALTAFYKVFNAGLTERKNINERYNATIAKTMSAELDDKIGRAYSAAVDEINAIAAKTEAAIAKWNNLDPANITADKNLLDLGLDLNDSEYREIIERNKNNALMQRYIAKILDSKKPRPYVTTYTAEEKANVYKKFAASALSTVETIRSGGCTQLMLDAWGEESDFSAPLYNIIGTGKELPF